MTDLDDPNNHAVAIFDHAPEMVIVVGNVREGDVPDVNAILLTQARHFFGEASVKSTGSAKGSAKGRWDCHIAVVATRDEATEFVQRRLKGGANKLG